MYFCRMQFTSDVWQKVRYMCVLSISLLCVSDKCIAFYILQLFKKPMMSGMEEKDVDKVFSNIDEYVVLTFLTWNNQPEFL